MCHILLNSAFRLFWSVLGEIHRELFFLDIKVTTSEMSTKILRNLFCFLPCLKRANSGENLDLLKQKLFFSQWHTQLLNYAFLLFWSIFGEIHRELFFLVKELYEFLPKHFKTTERHSLAVYSSLSGVKLFLLIFIPLYMFDKKKVFKQIQIFLRICPFWNMVRKTNFLSISVLVSEIVTLMSKKKSSLWIFPKMLQNNRKA